METLAQHFTKPKLLKYTLPTMAMMFVSSAYTIVDGLFVSNLVGKTALASMSLIFPFVMILSSLGIMMGAGGGAVVGQLLGAGDRKGANRAFSLIAWVTFITGAICSVFGFIFMDIAFLLMGVAYFGSSMFTSVENGKISALIAFVEMFVFELGCVMLLPMIFGADGIWWSIVVAEVAASIFTIALLARYARGYSWC